MVIKWFTYSTILGLFSLCVYGEITMISNNNNNNKGKESDASGSGQEVPESENSPSPKKEPQQIPNLVTIINKNLSIQKILSI